MIIIIFFLFFYVSASPIGEWKMNMLLSSGKCVPAASELYGNIVRKNTHTDTQTPCVWTFEKHLRIWIFSAVDKSSLSLSNTRLNFKHCDSINAWSHNFLCAFLCTMKFFSAQRPHTTHCFSTSTPHGKVCFFFLVVVYIWKTLHPHEFPCWCFFFLSTSLYELRMRRTPCCFYFQSPYLSNSLRIALDCIVASFRNDVRQSRIMN